jgi:hypothetical protein
MRAMTLDVEGAKLSVLKGIDFTKAQIKHFLIEAWEIDEIAAFLATVGYVQGEQMAHRDYLFTRVEEKSPASAR